MATRWRLLVVLGVLLGLVSPVARAQAAGPSAPTGLAPNATTVTTNPVLTWTAVPGAAKYDVQIATDPSFAAPSYSATTALTVATPTTTIGATVDGPMYWRVRSVDASGAPGPYTTAQFWRTALPGPVLLTPADNAVLDFPADPPLLSWMPLAGAAKYTVQIDDAADFVGATSYTTTNPSLALTAPQPAGQPYFWRVQGVTKDGIVTAWSQTRSYSTGPIGAPVLSYPADGTTTSIDDVVLTWNPVAGAVTYHVQVSPNIDFTNNTYDVEGVKSTRWSPATTLLNGSYYWRVQARDVQGAYGAWSAIRSFRRAWPAKPTLLTPADGVIPPTTDQGPTFTWTPVGYADRYELDLGTDMNFSPGTYVTCHTNHTTFTPQYTVSQTTQAITNWSDPDCDDASEPAPGLVWWWRVRGIDDPSGVVGVYSDRKSFSYTPLVDSTGGLTLLGPADGATVTVPTLSWSAVPDVSSYSVQVFDKNGTKVWDTSTYALSWTPPTALVAANSPFTWRVAADTGGTTYAALQRTFSIGGSLTTTATPDPVHASPTSGTRMPMMSWSPVTGASSYRVWFRPGAGCVSDSNHPWFQLVAPATLGTYAYPSTTFASDTSSGLPTLAPGDYDWYVQANLAGGGTSQSSCATYTIQPIAEATGLTVHKPASCPDASGAPAVCDTPSFSWNPVNNAGFYYVYISTDAAHTNIVHIYATDATTLTPRESLRDSQAGQTYYWYVRPCLEESACGPLGDQNNNYDFIASFEKRSSAERAYSPTDGWAAPSTWPTAACVAAAPPAAVPTVADQPTFCWNDYLSLNTNESVDAPQEAKVYRLQVSTVADFSTLLDSVDVDQTTYTPTAKTYPEGPLYWHVQAIDGSGNVLTSSPTYQLLKSSPAPVVTSPASGAQVDQAPVLQWQPEQFAASYEVEIYKHAGAASGDSLYSPVNRIVDATTEETAYTYTAALATDTYAWRVRRIDADRRPGQWQQQINGQPLVFSVSPAAPAQLTPASGSAPSARSLLFTWAAAPAAAGYRFESSLSNSFATTRERVDTVSLAWAPTAVYPTGNYYWRVSSIDGSGNVLATSATWTFSVDSTPPTVTSKAPTITAGITDSFRATFSEPVQNVSTATAQLVASGTGTVIAATVTQPTAASVVLRPTSALEPGCSYAVRLSSGITDLSGNPLAPYSWTVRASTTIDNGSPALHEAWDRDNAWLAVGHRYSTTATPGATATLHFTGTSVQLLAHVAPDGGFASIRLDNRSPVKVSFFRRTRAERHVVWSATRLSAGSHTLTVTALGSEPRASHDAWVSVDAARVGTTMIDDSSPAWTTRFRPVHAATAFDGSYDVEHQVAAADSGPHATYSVGFTGSGYTIFLAKGRSGGRAQVLVDGMRVATVDLYSTAAMSRVPVLTRTVASRHHTLSIVISGARDAASRGTDVGLDEITIR